MEICYTGHFCPTLTVFTKHNHSADLVSIENVPSIYSIFNIIQACIVTISDYCLATLFEFFEIVNDSTTIKCCTIFKGWLVNYDFGTFGLNSFHYTLN